MVPERAVYGAGDDLTTRKAWDGRDPEQDAIDLAEVLWTHVAPAMVEAGAPLHLARDFGEARERVGYYHGYAQGVEDLRRAIAVQANDPKFVPGVELVKKSAPAEPVALGG